MTTRILLQNSPILKSPRQITVLDRELCEPLPGLQPYSRYYPEGQWLEDAGFTTGTQVM